VAKIAQGQEAERTNHPTAAAHRKYGEDAITRARLLEEIDE
jgi:hypothetical protein